MHHVKDFLLRQGECHGLAFCSEQSFKAVHSDFKAEWEKVKVGIDNKDHIEILKKAVTRYNARHV